MITVYDFAPMNFDSFKKAYLTRLGLFIALCAVFAAIFIISISFPGIKWVTMVLAAAECIICAILGVVLLAKPGREYCFASQIRNGIKNSEKITVQSIGETVFTDCMEFTRISATATMEDGTLEDRTFYVKTVSFNVGDNLNVVTHDKYIIQYEIII